ncbi:TetR family transcriptional regulator [Micrococcales bacterium 31B]|nr:TetR family transcriptional regulator [Micrococcales bacterium 31B]
MTTVETNTRRGRPGYDRDSMLDVIVEAFNDHGYDATSLGIISRRLGLSKSAVYHHFTSKEEMLELALARAVDSLRAVFEAPEAVAGPVAERVRFVVRAAVLVACEQLPYVTLLLRLRGNTDVERQAMEERRAFDARLADLFELASVEGVLRNDLQPRVVSRLAFGLVNSVVEWYQPSGALQPEALADTVVALVTGGLSAPGRVGRAG